MKKSPLLLALTTMALLSSCASTPSEYELDLDSLLNSTSEYQKEIMQDGSVSEDEYEKSIYAWWQCSKDVGAEPREMKRNFRGDLGFEILIEGSSRDQALQISSEVDACQDEYASEVATLYAHQRVLPLDDKEAMLPQAVACLNANGLGLEASQDYDSVIKSILTADDETHRKLEGCYTEYPGFFEMPYGYEVSDQ